MSNALTILNYAIRPALQQLALADGYERIASPAAEELLLGIAAAESGLVHLRQIGGGPALGLWQIEAGTHDDVWSRFVAYRPSLRAALEPLLIPALSRDTQIATNAPYAAAIARLVLWRAGPALPARGDVAGYAAYWRDHYNTHLGAGTVEHFLAAWRQHVAPVLGR